MYDTAEAPVANEDQLRAMEAEYCSWGDTVHYMAEPKYFAGCDGSFMFDAEGCRFLDLSWFQNLELCLKDGLTRYQSGQAAYVNKLRLGSTLLQTSMYFRHRNPVVNGVLRIVAPLFSADLGGEAAA